MYFTLETIKRNYISVLKLDIWISLLLSFSNKLILRISLSCNYIFTIFFPCLLPHISASLPRSIATLLHGICTSGRWMNEWMNERMYEWMNEWMNEWMIEWMNRWLNERMNDWMNDWMNELIYKSVHYCDIWFWSIS